MSAKMCAAGAHLGFGWFRWFLSLLSILSSGSFFSNMKKVFHKAFEMSISSRPKKPTSKRYSNSCSSFTAV